MEKIYPSAYLSSLNHSPSHVEEESFLLLKWRLMMEKIYPSAFPTSLSHLAFRTTNWNLSVSPLSQVAPSWAFVAWALSSIQYTWFATSQAWLCRKKRPHPGLFSTVGIQLTCIPHPHQCHRHYLAKEALAGACPESTLPVEEACFQSNDIFLSQQQKQTRRELG